MNNKCIIQLAEEHWNFIAPIVDLFELTDRNIHLVRYLYVASFIHGYKHAMQEVENGTAIPPKSKN